jgi:hypothetical protein
MSFVSRCSHLHAHKGPGNWQILAHLVEILVDIDADDSIHNHDVARILLASDKMSQDIAACGSGLRCVHFEFIHFVCPILLGKLRQTQKRGT